MIWQRLLHACVYLSLFQAFSGSPVFAQSQVTRNSAVNNNKSLVLKIRHSLSAQSSATSSGNTKLKTEANVNLAPGSTIASQIGSNNGEKLSNNQKIKLNHENKTTSLKKLNYVNSKIEYIRVIRSTNFDFFSNKAKKIFLNEKFRITKLMDRMGMRLEGHQLENIATSNIKSEGLVKGVIQVPSDGNPIIMLADHGTIGGYPKIANVISADLDKLVQMPPGSYLKFREVTLEEAEKIFNFYNLETNNFISQIS